MKSSVAVALTVGIILIPIIATIIYGISIFNEIKVTSILSIPIFCIILLLHILIIYITYRRYDRSTEFTCHISAPYYDFFLLILQIGFVIFGILLAIVNMQNTNGKCAFVSSSSVVTTDDGEGNHDDNDDFDLNVQNKTPLTATFPLSSSTVDDDDMDSGSASCGGVTIVFLIACGIFCLKLFTLPILKNLTSLTKQVRSSTLHPMTIDPRIRINGLSAHETFNVPTSASSIPRVPSSRSTCTPSHIQRANSSVIRPPNNDDDEITHAYFLSIPPPPTYEESLHASPPSYTNLANLL
jgi:hypothetical protein